MTRQHRTILFCALLAAAFAPARARAAVPQTFTQQGRLLNTDGTPVAGPVRMIFNVYDSSSSTTPLWTETQSNVMLDSSSGAFSVQLGSVTPFPSGLWSGATLYLGVTVGNDAEMTPREQITSVPYALLADNCANLGGVAASQYALQSMLKTGTVTSVATGDGLQGGPITSTGTIAVDNTVSRAGHSHSLSCAFQNATSSASNYSFAACPANTFLTGGGCSRTTSGASGENRSSPATDGTQTWECTTVDGTAITAYAICCNVTVK